MMGYNRTARPTVSNVKDPDFDPLGPDARATLREAWDRQHQAAEAIRQGHSQEEVLDILLGNRPAVEAPEANGG
jgi:hypothetical protein